MVKDDRTPAETDGDNTGEPDVGAGIGVLLRETREKAGESRREVSRVLRIRRMYLEAIEDGRYQDLPGPAYATGFIRSYAEHLGLDSEEILRRFRIEAKDLGGKVNLNFPVPVPESGLPGGPVLILGLIIAAVSFGAWTFYSSDDSKGVDLISPPPDHLAAIVPPDAAPISNDDGLTPAVETETQPATASDNAATASPEGSENASAEPAVAPEPAPGPPQSETAAVTGTNARTPTVAPDPSPAAEPSTSPDVVAVSGSGVQVQSASATVESEIRPPSSAPVETETPAPAGAITQVPAGAITPAPEDASTIVQRQETGVETIPRAIEREATIIRGSGDDAIRVAVIPPVPEMPAVEPRKVRTYGEENGKSRILLRARVNSWVQIRDDINDRLLVTRLLRVGDSVRVPDRPGLKLMTGNAGGLDILVDGEAVPPIGPLGAVRRGVILDVETLRRGPAGLN